MKYFDFKDEFPLWLDLDLQDDRNRELQYSQVVLADAELNALLGQAAWPDCHLYEVDKLRYALAADYIEENWDRLLSIAETASGVDPEPLLRRLLHRLRKEWADYQNGVGK